MPDVEWLYAPNIENLIGEQAHRSFTKFSKSFDVFHSSSEVRTGAHLIGGFLYNRLLETRDLNHRREMDKPDPQRRTIFDAFGSIDKFVSFVFDVPKVRLGTLPEQQDLINVYQQHFCGFWPFC